jgi:hypothetical protein
MGMGKKLIKLCTSMAAGGRLSQDAAQYGDQHRRISTLKGLFLFYGHGGPVSPSCPAR